MASASLRFNFAQPAVDPAALSDRYRAAIEMTAYAETHGFAFVTLDEHHGVDDGWLPAPFVAAGLLLGATQRIRVELLAALLPLHEPIRVAEDLAVLDLASAGRLSMVAGLGYREEEYRAVGRSWAERGRLMDQAVDIVLHAWTGEPFDHRGTTVKVTPAPFTKPHPPFSLGGTSKPAARRAARFGLPLYTAAHLPDLATYYEEQCERYGTKPDCTMPPPDLAMVHIADDPDRAWAELGEHFLHEAMTYARWQTPDIASVMESGAFDAGALRAEGIYQILTPAECVERVRAGAAGGHCTLHPLCGGLPIDAAWQSLQLYVDQVLPALA